MNEQAPEIQIQKLADLKTGQRLEARLHNTTYYRGQVEQIAPGLDVLWIREEPPGDRKLLHIDDYELWLQLQPEEPNSPDF